jgi:hypothetical protein
MRHVKDNPRSNKIPAGIKEEDLADAISRSGYPLQTVISNRLKELSFLIEEEWTYIDSESEQEKERNLDIFASKPLWDYERMKHKPIIEPRLNLLVECKRSDSPYLFFLSSGKIDTFPNFTGLKKEHLSVHSEAGRMDFPYSTALSLRLLPFIKNKDEVCMTFSKCVEGGKKRLTLTGEEPYNAIVKPLIKAIKYYQSKEKAKSTYRYFKFHLIVGLVIIDAPMIEVKVGKKRNVLRLSPWVRVNRRTSREPGDNRIILDEGFSFDVVHKDYLDKYINRHLLPFANEFARLVRKHEGELVSGESYLELKTGGKLGYDIESLLQPNKSK